MVYLPALYEQNVEFGPGNGLEKGYICYPKETDNENTVWFTQAQYKVSLANDVMIFFVMATSYLTIWFTFKKAVNDKNDNLAHDELARLRVNVRANILEKRMIFTIGIICVYYVLLRFPIFFYGRTQISKITFGLGFCIVLYKIQFCLHFIVYAIIHESYRNAYFDILKILVPCCFKREKKFMIASVNEEKKKQKTSQLLRITEPLRFSMEDQLDVS